MTVCAQHQSFAESISPVGVVVYHWCSDGDSKSSRQVKVQKSPDGRKSQWFLSIRWRELSWGRHYRDFRAYWIIKGTPNPRNLNNLSRIDGDKKHIIRVQVSVKIYLPRCGCTHGYCCPVANVCSHNVFNIHLYLCLFYLCKCGKRTASVYFPGAALA